MVNEPASMKRLRACSETVDESGLAFPLTPALSLGARENVRRRVEDDHHSLFAERGRLQCPLLGERVRVRGIADNECSSHSNPRARGRYGRRPGGAAAPPYPAVVGRTCRSANYYRERALRCSRLRQATSLKGSSRRKEAPFSGGLKRVSLLTSPATRLIGDAGRQSQQLLRLSALGLGSAFGLRLSTLP